MTVSGPDFVGIGAQKAGTTWIHERLASHPQAWVPPIKELHYFNIACPHRELLGVESYQHAGLGPKLQALRARPSPSTLRWLYRFARNDATADWYRRLFEQGAGRQKGEITPAYSTLDERGVGFARHVLRPGCKVFLVMRDPVQRMWSSLKMYYRWLDEDPGGLSPEQVLDFANAPGNRLRTDYPRMVRLWRSHFDDKFRVFLYDDLRESPEAFLNDVCGFLGLDPLEPTAVSTERSNADPVGRRMPEATHDVLESHFHDQVEELDGLLPGVAERWEGGRAR